MTGQFESREEMEARVKELTEAKERGEEVWLTFRDLIALGKYVELKPGERVSSETGEIRYSADWLSD